MAAEVSVDLRHVLIVRVRQVALRLAQDLYVSTARGVAGRLVAPLCSPASFDVLAASHCSSFAGVMMTSSRKASHVSCLSFSCHETSSPLLLRRDQLLRDGSETFAGLLSPLWARSFSRTLWATDRQRIREGTNRRKAELEDLTDWRPCFATAVAPCGAASRPAARPSARAFEAVVGQRCRDHRR